jgi:hypothetical protein
LNLVENAVSYIQKLEKFPLFLGRKSSWNSNNNKKVKSTKLFLKKIKIANIFVILKK